MAQAVIEQAFELWINPEIERRREVGALPHDFVLTRAQVIFDMEAEAPLVRLNEEIKAVAIIKAARPIKKGQPVTYEDVAEVQDIGLTEDDPNAGHLTILLTPDGWTLAFDFRRNAMRIAGHVAAAEEFLAASSWARDQGHKKVFVDTLLSATELMAKGFLISLPDEKLLTTRRHGYIQAQFNAASKLDNVDRRFAALLNKLWRLRRPARYLSTDLTLTAEEMDGMLAVAREMLVAVRASSPKRHSTAA